PSLLSFIDDCEQVVQQVTTNTNDTLVEMTDIGRSDNTSETNHLMNEESTETNRPTTTSDSNMMCTSRAYLRISINGTISEHDRTFAEFGHLRINLIEYGHFKSPYSGGKKHWSAYPILCANKNDNTIRSCNLNNDDNHSNNDDNNHDDANDNNINHINDGDNSNYNNNTSTETNAINNTTSESHELDNTNNTTEQVFNI
ncbi:unnamed protein product, partial [Rotaria sp. Silwood2]